MAIAKELQMRKTEFQNDIVETIYFGGGTPSVLTSEEINFLIETVYRHYVVIENPEITLEANPDDLSEERIIELSKSKINRLSIGIQSFFEEDLLLMNRAHNSAEAKKCLQVAKMLQQLLGLKELPKNLDSTDGLAAAVCHFFNSGKVVGAKSYTGWDAFVKQNEERVKK